MKIKKGKLSLFIIFMIILIGFITAYNQGKIATVFHKISQYSEEEQPASEISDINIEQIHNDFEKTTNESNTDFLSKDGIVIDNKKNESLETEAVTSGTDLEKLINLQKEIEKTKDEKDKLDSDLFILNNEIATYKNELRKNEKNKEDKEKVLGIYFNWLNKTHNTLDLYLSILQASNLSEVVYNYNVTNQFIKKTISNINELNKDNYDLDLNRDNIVNKKALYRTLITDISIKENKLIEKHNEMVDILNNSPTILNESYRSTNNINSRINGSRYKYSGALTGGMILPVDNYVITSEWGDRIHPISGQLKHHSGVDLGVDTGTVVRAAASGVVTMASWYGGYGKAVMIDHGNGIVTLYGHNSKLLVSEGDTVQQGQPVALAGSTGYSTGPHCHFEVRYNDTDINPFTYIQ